MTFGEFVGRNQRNAAVGGGLLGYLLGRLSGPLADWSDPWPTIVLTSLLLAFSAVAIGAAIDCLLALPKPARLDHDAAEAAK